MLQSESIKFSKLVFYIGYSLTSLILFRFFMYPSTKYPVLCTTTINVGINLLILIVLG
jgi:hypothetical protein